MRVFTWHSVLISCFSSRLCPYSVKQKIMKNNSQKVSLPAPSSPWWDRVWWECAGSHLLSCHWNTNHCWLGLSDTTPLSPHPVIAQHLTVQPGHSQTLTINTAQYFLPCKSTEYKYRDWQSLASSSISICATFLCRKTKSLITWFIIFISSSNILTMRLLCSTCLDNFSWRSVIFPPLLNQLSPVRLVSDLLFQIKLLILKKTFYYFQQFLFFITKMFTSKLRYLFFSLIIRNMNFRYLLKDHPVAPLLLNVKITFCENFIKCFIIL